MGLKLEILVQGIEDHKKELDLQLREIQKQLDEVDSNDIECAFFIDKGEKTDEERAQVLINDCKAKFYCVVAYDTILVSNFVIRKFQAIINGKTTKQLNEMGVFMKPPSLQETAMKVVDRATKEN